MKTHVIVDATRPRANVTLETEMQSQGINWETWPIVQDKDNVVRSINLSHKQIVAYAQYYELPEVCIMEEDVMFTAPDSWQYFLSNKPVEFDLYLAGVYGLNETAYNNIAENPGAVEINNFAGLHCYIIRARYYSTFLSLPDNIHIDNQPGLGVFYVCAPFAALQHPGWSANARAMVDYNCDPKSLPPKCIYYGKR